MKKIFFPLTKYHVFLSFLFSEDGDSIVFDRRLFGDEFINRVSLTGRWGSVVKVPIRRGIRGFFYKYIFRMGEVAHVLSAVDKEVVFFSPGSRFYIFIINVLSAKNSVTMMDDGLAPYYMSNLSESWRRALGKRRKNYIYDLLWYIFDIKEDFSYVDCVRLIRPGLLSADMRSCGSNFDTADRVEEGFPKIFGLINLAFNSMPGVLKFQYRFVYFDGDLKPTLDESSELKSLENLFSVLPAGRILVKMRTADEGYRRDRIELYENFLHRLGRSGEVDFIHEDVPWEIIYMNNRETLLGSIYISPYISTVMITSDLIFGDARNSLLLDRLLIPSYRDHCQEEIDDFIGRLSVVGSKTIIYRPSSGEEIAQLVARIDAGA
jgi:hypothetical protein